MCVLLDRDVARVVTTQIEAVSQILGVASPMFIFEIHLK